MVERVDNSIRSAVELEETAQLPNYIQVFSVFSLDLFKKLHTSPRPVTDQSAANVKNSYLATGADTYPYKWYHYTH